MRSARIFMQPNLERVMFKVLLVSTAFCLVSVAAHASVITSLPGDTAVAMPGINSLTAGPQTFGPITFTSTNTYELDPSVFGWNEGYGYVVGGAPLAGLNAEVGAINFVFSSTVAAVLADLGWSIPGNSGSLPVTAEIFDSSNTLLESLTLSSDGSVNDVPLGFYGFQRGTAEIKSLRLSNGFITGRSFSFSTGAVPEPATWLTMIVGFGLMGAAMRRRQKATLRYAF